MLKFRRFLKLTIVFSIVLFIIYGVSFALYRHSLESNNELVKTIENCLYKNDYKSLELDSIEGSFNISYTTNAEKNCINPSFPIIHIKLKQEHNALLQVVRTDCVDNKIWQEFIDADIEEYPFYSLQQDFYDAPLWSYTLFNKPLSYWIGHVYAVKVDHEYKIIKVVGGVKWGFKFAHFPVKPQMILPSSLSIKDWQDDWNLFKGELKGYKVNYD